MRVLLQTKLFRPTLSEAVVLRARLDNQRPAANRRLTLVAAPAGSGKTTLVAFWLREHRTAAWLALDEDDNKTEQFLAYLIGALQTVDSTIGQTAQNMLQAPQPPDHAVVVTTLINDLAALKREIPLVLDDYHLIAERAIHEIVTLLLDRAPPGFQLVIITRHDPPLPLARWRVRGQLAEIRAADLRFTHSEAAQFITGSMQIDLSDAAIGRLQQRTEGWIAGLQLAALSLRSQANPDQFIERFGGSDRFVADYLIEEVVGQQPLAIQKFLLYTSILRRFRAELCHAVLDNLQPLHDAGMVLEPADCQALIEKLNGANLFLVPLDQQQIWYRYHQLFADLLRSRLRREHAAHWSEVHIRASRWCEQAGLLEEAMHYALACGDSDRAAALIERHGLPLIGDGFISAVLDWMRHISEEQLRQRPLLSVIGAWVHILSQQVARAEQLTDLAQQRLDNTVSPIDADDQLPVSRGELIGHVAGLRAFVANSYGQVDQTISLAQLALASLPAYNTLIHPPVLQLLGIAYAQTGQLEKAQQTLRRATEATLDGTNRYIAISSRSVLADLLTNIGMLAEAQQVYREAIIAGSPPQTAHVLPPLAYPFLNLAWIHYRWNELASMDTYLFKAETLAQEGGYTGLRLWAALLRARRATSALAFNQAADWIEQATALVEAHTSLQANRYHLALERGRLALAQGQQDLAEQQLQRCGVSCTAVQAQDIHSPAGYQFFVQHQDLLPTLGQLLLVQGQWTAVHDLVAWLSHAAQVTQYVVVGIQSAVLGALAYHAQGHGSQAQTALAGALELAAPRNLQRVLIEVGLPLVAPLRVALIHGHYTSFIQRVLAAPELANASRPSAPTVGLPEPLTEREAQILRLLAAGMNSTEIAAQLILAPSTVRSYIKSLYSKLDVNRRHDAIERARALNLL